MGSSNEWKIEAHRGRCRVVVMTPERARAACVPFEEDAVLVAEVRPDEEPARSVSFRTRQAARVFLYAICPRSWSIETAPTDPRVERPLNVLFGPPDAN